MLRKFKITIDGQEYLVEMEEIGGTPVPTGTPNVVPTSAPVAPVAEVATPAPTPAAPVAVTADTMMAPMPGTVLKLLVAEGEQVTENQPLLILEAMKMENEIVADKAGTVSQIFVDRNQAINAGDALISIQ